MYQLNLTVLLKNSIHHLQVQEHIGNWIHRAQLSDPLFKQQHYDLNFKHYVFSAPYPLEKDGIYQKGRAYIITIRSSKESILDRIAQCMTSCREDEWFQLIASEKRKKNHKHITEMITITPAIVTLAGKPWLHEQSIEILIKQLHGNAEKKFKQLQPENQVESIQEFIQGIRVENRKPLALTYKGKKMLGNKLRIFVNEDPYSQQLAWTVMGSGLAERNSSLGAGFCLAKGLDS